MQSNQVKDLDELMASAELLQASNSLANADVYTVTRDSESLLIKTYRRRAAILKWLFARRAIRHEFGVLQQLQGLPGIPKVYNMPDDDTLIMEFVNGPGPLKSARRIRPEEYPHREFFIRLKALVQAIHQRGISHGDMRRKNIIRGSEHQPYLIDFATAVQTNGTCRWLRNLLYEMLKKADHFALAKIVDSYYPDLLSPQEQEWLNTPPWYLRFGRFLRQKIYRPFIKQKRWKERFRKVRRHFIRSESLNSPEGLQ